MLKGIRFKANPNARQRVVLSEWMGCAKTIWNAKCDDESYMTYFAGRYYPMGTYAPIDQSYSQYKNKELTPWLYDCPSQILRNSAVNWYNTYRKFIKGVCGKPARKYKSCHGSIHLTRELFQFEHCTDGNMRLFIGTKRNNIGYLSFKKHRGFRLPSSLYITKKNGVFYISFCFETARTGQAIPSQKETFKHLQSCSTSYLERHTVGIDRGVAIPLQVGDQAYDYTANQKKSKERHARYIKRLQQQLSRRQKRSVRYKRTKRRLSARHASIAHIRKDFCHKASHAIVKQPEHKIIVLEDLKTKHLTKSPKPKPNQRGGWDKNGAKAKAGLNKAILDKGWHLFETYVNYKAEAAGKVVFKVPAHHTSQACSACDDTHPDNRKSQSEFVCGSCGYTDHADRNAACNIKKRAIKRLKNSGTELSNRGVLTLRLDTGRGAERKPKSANVVFAVGDEPSKKKMEQVKLTC